MDEGQRSYYKHLLNHPILSHIEEKETLKLVAKGDTTAREKMVLHNLRLVFNIAAKSKNHLPLDDRFGAGCEALYRALDKFDTSKGGRFSTYATPWIKQFIYRASIDSDPLRLPENVHSLLKDRDKFSLAYLQQYGTKPSKDLIKNHIRKNIWQITTDTILEFAATYNGTYLYDPLDNYLVVTSKDNVEDEVMNDIIASEIHRILENILTPVEHYILMYRYGLNNKTNPNDRTGRDKAIVSHRSIADKLEITRQRVQQIEAKVLQTLKEYFEQENLYHSGD